MAAVFKQFEWKFTLVIVCALQGLSSAGPKVSLRSNNQLYIHGVNQVTSFNTQYEAYYGLPYAQPPVGPLRFANPVPFVPWTGVYNATVPKPPCIQYNEITGNVTGDEDCLYLNVYRPKHPTCVLPVMVYIHGGQFQWGSADPTYSGPGRLMDSKEVILVTVSYRLGAMGFLSTGDSAAPGNFGLKDQSQAILWVRQNIDKFGGNNNLITIFGEDAGGAATQLHMMSPLSRGNFSNAIMMSGSALAMFYQPNPNPLATARLQVKVLGNSNYATLTSSDLITWLRTIPATQLAGSYVDLVTSVDPFNSVAVYRPVIEQFVAGQSFLNDDPSTLWAAGNYEQIPWMAGHVPNEWILFVRILNRIIQNPTQWLNLVVQGPDALPLSLGLGLSSGPALMQRFFSTLNLGSLSVTQVAQLAYNLASEVQYEYPLLTSLTQHLQRNNPLIAPVSMYFMNFAGPFSVSSLFAPGTSFPIVHTDDLQYVLSRPALFPEFTFGSPAFLMSKNMVKMFSEFARTGYVLSSNLGTCSTLNGCQQIELGNGPAGLNTFQVQLTNSIDSDVLNFWNGLYTSPCYQTCGN